LPLGPDANGVTLNAIWRTFWALLGAPAQACQLVTESCQATTAERIDPGSTPHIAEEVRHLYL